MVSSVTWEGPCRPCGGGGQKLFEIDKLYLLKTTRGFQCWRPSHSKDQGWAWGAGLGEGSFFLINDGNALVNVIVLGEDLKKDKLFCFDLCCPVVRLPSVRMCVAGPHQLDALPHRLLGRGCQELSFAYILPL